MSDVWSGAPEETFTAELLQSVGAWEEQAILQPDSKAAGDRFGYNIALDEEQMVGDGDGDGDGGGDDDYDDDGGGGGDGSLATMLMTPNDDDAAPPSPP
jgi:hypothetical protein